MARFKLIAGKHTAREKPKKEGERGALVHYSRGDVVESDRDLVKQFGSEKFQFLGGKVEEFDTPANAREFPHGQVHSGMQKATPKGEAPHRSTVDQELTDDLPPVNEDAIPEGEADDGLEELKLDELKELASEQEIDLSGAHKKVDIINRIRQSREEDA